jgi:transcriptional regulator with XRE-family HTH domain
MDAKELIAGLRAVGLSQKDIGGACGLSQGAISHIETGRSKGVLFETHQKLETLYAEKVVAAGDAPQAVRS